MKTLCHLLFAICLLPWCSPLLAADPPTSIPPLRAGRILKLDNYDRIMIDSPITFRNGGDRTAFGAELISGAGVQAHSAALDIYSGISPSANVQTLLGAANYAAFKTSLSLTIGTNVQAYSANLTTFAGIAPSANVQTLLGAADYAAFRASLSLDHLSNTAFSGTFTIGNGSATIGAAGQISAFTNPTNLQTTGGALGLAGFGSITGMLPIANGGTGQGTATGAITALLPSQTSNSNKFLQTTGTGVQWTNPPYIFDVDGNRFGNSGGGGIWCPIDGNQGIGSNSGTFQIDDSGFHGGTLYYNGGGPIIDSAGQIYYVNGSLLADSSNVLYYPNGSTLIGGSGYIYSITGNPIFRADGTFVFQTSIAFVDPDGTIHYPNGNVLAVPSDGSIRGDGSLLTGITVPQVSGATPVADGTYTVGIGGTQNGTITIQNGIITAVQEAIP